MEVSGVTTRQMLMSRKPEACGNPLTQGVRCWNLSDFSESLVGRNTENTCTRSAPFLCKYHPTSSTQLEVHNWSPASQ